MHVAHVPRFAHPCSSSCLWCVAQSNCETGRLLGAATPLVPSATPVPRHPKPIRRRSPWNDDSSSAMPRAPRHQGPPVHPQRDLDQAAPQEYDAIPPPADQDSMPPRRYLGSRPGMHGRPRMRIPAATATRFLEQPAMPSKSESERAERSESYSEVSADVISCPVHLETTELNVIMICFLCYTFLNRKCVPHGRCRIMETIAK